MRPGFTFMQEVALSDNPPPTVHVIPLTPHPTDILERSATLATLPPPVLPTHPPAEVVLPTLLQESGSPTKKPKCKHSLTKKAEGIVTEDWGWGYLGRMHAQKKKKYTV
jgi:hypothetical protein